MKNFFKIEYACPLEHQKSAFVILSAVEDKANGISTALDVTLKNIKILCLGNFTANY